MMSSRRAITLLALVLITASAVDSSARAKPRKLALATLEGAVTETREIAGEGGLETLAVVLELAGKKAEPASKTVLLAPRSSCEEIGFEVEVGDRLRVKIFVEEKGPTKAHKALNLTRGTMVRFRTLRSIPLWNAMGAWQGGPRGTQPGAQGQRRAQPGAGSRSRP